MTRVRRAGNTKSGSGTKILGRSTAIYDAGVLIAAGNNVETVWRRHKARQEAGYTLLVPAPVLAQVVWDSRQVQLHRFLQGCHIAEFGEEDAHEAGRLLGRADVSGTPDIPDAAVVVLALRRYAIIISDDRRDISRLVAASGQDIPVFPSH